MGLQAAGADVLLVALRAFERPLVGVETLVQLQVDELREFGRTELASEGFLPRVKPRVGFQVRSRGESLQANLRKRRSLC